ncbi:GNAT family N-acetyltransferase [Lysinibacillus sp. NPDC093210]|uniref:GNAT family N-acetyltransferase n=1 Tax=Lysinibacillus sp. NPDC093210 TaxID=3364133 RepID=UPI00382A55E4
MVTIRNVEKNELDFLTDMLYESIHIVENKPKKEDLINSIHIKKYHESWGREGDSALIALNKENQPVGAVWYRLFNESNKGYGFVDRHTPELGIAVAEEVRKKGIGTLLMKAIIDQAINEGYKSISLSVDLENSHAIHIYKKLGFEEYEVSGTSMTMVLRVKGD